MSTLDVNISDSFEMGKIAGARDVLLEMKELAILDSRFQTYIDIKIKHFNEKIDLMTKYKAIADFKGDL